MAKIRNYAFSAERINKQINTIVNDLSYSVLDTAMQNVAIDAVDVAKKTILSNHEHTQQYGDKLAEQVSYRFTHNGDGDAQVFIYTPVSDDPYIAQQMYYLEHGAGITSAGQESIKKVWGESGIWGFIVDPHAEGEIEKLPNIHYKKRKNRAIFKKATGEKIALVKESKPVHYMQAARRYIVRHTEREMREQINTYFVRKTWKNRTTPFRGRKTK